MSGTASKRALSASRKLVSVVSSSVSSSTSFRGNASQMSHSTDSRQAAHAPRARARFSRAAGFNLVELLVVTTIAAILFGIGIPSYKYVTTSSRVSTEVNELLGDMQLARAEAIKEGQTVTVCPANANGTGCSGTTNWAGGWIVFSDFNADGAVETGPPNNDMVIRYQAAFGGTDTFGTQNELNNWVSFNRDGFATNLNQTDADHLLFTLQTTPVVAQWTRCLEVTMAGQMTTEHSGTGLCH
jgi:type IV fimbrial biogenesis protein FimT